MHIRLVLLMLALLGLSSAKVYTRCELASALVANGVPRAQVPDWVCLATAESSLNSRAINNEPDGSADLEIFQIKNTFWCSQGQNLCGVSCSALQSDDIGPSIQCAKQIYQGSGFSAWSGWTSQCQGRNLNSYVQGCTY